VANGSNQRCAKYEDTRRLKKEEGERGGVKWVSEEKQLRRKEEEERVMTVEKTEANEKRREGDCGIRSATAA
jgi:hypothetical protein